MNNFGLQPEKYTMSGLLDEYDRLEPQSSTFIAQFRAIQQKWFVALHH
jgi:hypothetical protein